MRRLLRLYPGSALEVVDDSAAQGVTIRTTLATGNYAGFGEKSNL